jgi:hypothetical protein
MPTSRPPWRVVVDRLDRTVSPRADTLVRTNLFADSVAAFIRLEAQVRRRLEHQSARIWHLYNLPTATDIRRMRGQLASVEARLRDVSERLEESEDARRAAEQARTQANGTEQVRSKANGTARKPRAPRRSSVNS